MLFAFNVISICLYRLLLSQVKISNKKKDAWFLIICSIQFVLIAGTRTLSTGADTYAYYQVFNTIKRYTNPFTMPKQNQEFLYILLSWCFGKIGLSFELFNIFIASLTMSFLSFSIYKLSPNVFLSIYLFYCFSLFNQMLNQYRQILAMAIFLYSLSCWLEGKKGKSLAFIIVAAGFHVSVLVTIPFILLSKVKINRKVISKYILATFVALLFSQVVLYLISFTQYAGYINSWYDVRNQGSVIANTFVRIILLLFCFYFHSALSEKLSCDYLYHMALWCTSFQILALNSALFGRITTYFYTGYMFLIPEIMVNGFKEKNNKLILNIVVFLIFILYYLVYNNALEIKTSYSSVLFS